MAVDWKVYAVGDIRPEVSIQSMSTVFAMAKVIKQQVPDAQEVFRSESETNQRNLAIAYAPNGLGRNPDNTQLQYEP